MKRNSILMLSMLVMISVFLLVHCTPKSEYQLRVERELASGVRADSLFLGYYFGMTKKAFMDHSWELNKEGVISGYSTIGHTFTELEYPALMEFFPEFHDDRIVRMPVKIEYRGWAPWNDHLAPEVLMTDLVKHYEEKYGEQFDEIRNEEVGAEEEVGGKEEMGMGLEMGDVTYVSIRGNRQIRIFKESVSKVMLEFTDLSVSSMDF